MNIGLDTPEDAKVLADALVSVENTAHLCNDFFTDQPSRLWRTGTRIAELLQGLPEPAVDPRLSLQNALLAASGSLQQLRSLFTESLATTPVVLSALLRTALLGASRVVFILGLDAAADRRTNLQVVIRQEHTSLGRLYDNAEKFTSLTALIPPSDVLDAQRDRIARCAGEGRPMGEAKMLTKMADVVTSKLRARGLQGDGLVMAEQLSWIFDTHSGIVHGYGWPHLVPGTQDVPGHFITDFFMVANLGQLAFQLAHEHTEPSAAD